MGLGIVGGKGGLRGCLELSGGDMKVWRIVDGKNGYLIRGWGSGVVGCGYGKESAE